MYGIARYDTDDNIILCLHFDFWITKATDAHSEYVTLIASPLQQWLLERASMLRYTYTACVLSICVKLIDLNSTDRDREANTRTSSSWCGDAVTLL
jgi:hypothetical protein